MLYDGISEHGDAFRSTVIQRTFILDNPTQSWCFTGKSCSVSERQSAVEWNTQLFELTGIAPAMEIKIKKGSTSNSVQSYSSVKQNPFMYCALELLQ